MVFRRKPLSFRRLHLLKKLILDIANITRYTVCDNKNTDKESIQKFGNKLKRLGQGKLVQT